MKRSLWLIGLFVFALSGQAQITQELDTFPAKASISGWKYFVNLFTEVDTNYIVKPSYTWTVKGFSNLSMSHVGYVGTTHDVKSVLGAQQSPNFSLGPGISFHGLSIAGGINPYKIRGKFPDMELNINAYSNRIAIDLIYADVQAYNGKVYLYDNEYDFGWYGFRQRQLLFNFVYIWNYKRFSMPAAFSQNQIQKKSAGSLLLGVSYIGSFYKALLSKDPTGTLSAYGDYDIFTNAVTIGAGYGYNFAIQNGHYLFHL